MKTRLKGTRRRKFNPSVTHLEERVQLSAVVHWVGQDGHDFVGTDTTRPNDYQDVHLQLTGLKTDAQGNNVPIQSISLVRFGGGEGANYILNNPAGSNGYLVYTGPGTADFYYDPIQADPAGTQFDQFIITYPTGSENDPFQIPAGATTVNPNLRMPDSKLSVQWLGQDGQDWTGPGLAAGPDGYQDLHLALSNISQQGTPFSPSSLEIILTTNPANPDAAGATTWRYGSNQDASQVSEFVNRAISSVANSTGNHELTGDLFVSPPSTDLFNTPLTLIVRYIGNSNNLAYKQDTFSIPVGSPARSAGANGGHTNATLAWVNPHAAPTVTKLTTGAASWLGQDGALGMPTGSVHVHLTGLPTNTSSLSAVLSNEYGMTWQTGAGGTGALNLQHTTGSSNADLFFLPVRNDESNDLMTLTLNFGGTQYFFQFQGGACSVNARGTPIGTTSLTVSSVSQLLAAVDTSHAADSTHQVAKIHLSAGTYNMTQPLVLNYPVQIDADPNVILSFTGIASASAAVQINSSHVTLQGFELLYPSSLNADVPLIRTGTDTIAVSITGMTLIDPNSLPPNSGYAHSIMVGGGSSGTISGNVLKGGTISLSSGPWEVSWNDYQGAAPNTTSPTLFETVNSHDLTLEYNHAHNVGTSGVTERFLTMGSSFYGNSFGDTIQNNTIDGGFGQTVLGNDPEIMLTENYWPFFEGRPSSVSADGYVVQVPFLRSTGAPLQSGDILSILSRSSSGTGAQPGDWIQISQVIDPSSGSFNNYTTVLLDKPLPQGCIISINRGFVNSTYKANRIDLRDPSLNPNDTGMVFPGNSYGLTVAQNVFLGKNSFDITAAVTQDYEGGSAWQVTPRWGQFHTPMLGVTITGNIVWDSTSSHIGVLHTPVTALDSGRVYFSGSLTDNQFNFSPSYVSAHPQAGPYLGITVGAPSYPAGYDYSGTQSPATLTAPPIDAGELRLTDSGNTTNLRTHGVYEDVRAATIASTVVRNQQRSLSYQGVYQDTGADYNGDGIADVGIYVPTDDKFALTFLNSQGQFVGGASQSVFTYSSHTGGVYSIPITGDFNGDGITDVGVYIPSLDEFALTFLNAQGQYVGGSSQSIFNFGYHTGGVYSVPITGDFNGDGITDVGVYVPTDNKFALTFLSSQGQFVGGASQSVFTYGYHNGSVNSVPITGDFNGDGVTDVGVYIPGDDKFELALLNGQGQYLGGASNQSIFTYSYHTGGVYSVPITGDFNGDGITDVGVYVPPDDKFALTFLNSQGQFVGGASQSVFTYSYHTGGVYSVPITGDYNGDGITDVGVYVPPDDKFALTFLNSQGQFVGGSSQSVFNYGYHQPTVYSVPLVTTSGPVTSNGIVANSIIRTTPLISSESTTSSTNSPHTTSAKTLTNASVTTRSTGTSTTTKTPVPQGILTSSPFRKGFLSF